MSKAENNNTAGKTNLILESMIAISFVMSFFANVISFYLTGNKNDLLRKAISQGLIFCITLCMVVYVVHKWFVSESITRKKILYSLIPLGLNGLLLFIGVLNASDKSSLFKIFLGWASYCVALTCGAVYIMGEERLQQIIVKMKYVAAIMTPFWGMAIWHLGHLSVQDDFSKGFGGLSHLTIGYSAVFIYSFLICDLAGILKERGNRASCLMVVIEMVICSLISVMSGGRGAFFAWVAVSLLAGITLLIKKEKGVVAGILLGTIAILVFCAAAPADNASINRQFSFIAELKNGDVKRSFVSEEGQDLITEIYNKADESQEITEIINTAGDARQDEETDKNFEEVKYSVTNGSMARFYLWQLAVKEMLQSPMLGMGPAGFQIKYRTYPHNILLECLSDFGLIAGILFMAACVALVALIIKYSISCRKYFHLIIILSGYAVYAMLSGTLYSCEALFFTFAIIIWQLTNRFVGKQGHSWKKRSQ